MLKIESLKPGDKISLIAPAGILRDPEKVYEAVEYIQSRGYNVVLGKNIFNNNDYLAGSDNERLEDLEDSFQRDDIKAIFCLRGGYGTMRLLDKIDYNIIQHNPKIFLGYSDITALHLAFYKYCNLNTFHGPLAASDFSKNGLDEFTNKNLWNILENKVNYPYILHNNDNYEVINKGKVSGKLLGGNLALLCALMGTRYLPDLSDKILFMEDIGENIYRLDRYLTQLKLSGILQTLKGCIFGNFTDITDYKGEVLNNNKIINLIKDTMKNVTIPAIFGFSCGHQKTKTTMLVGSNCELNTSKGTITIVKSCLT